MSHSHNLSHVGNLSFFLFFFHYLMPHRIPDCSTSMDSKINTFLGGLGKKKEDSRGQKGKMLLHSSGLFWFNFKTRMTTTWGPWGTLGWTWAVHSPLTTVMRPEQQARKPDEPPIARQRNQQCLTAQLFRLSRKISQCLSELITHMWSGCLINNWDNCIPFLKHGVLFCFNLD